MNPLASDSYCETSIYDLGKIAVSTTTSRYRCTCDEGETTNAHNYEVLYDLIGQ